MTIVRTQSAAKVCKGDRAKNSFLFPLTLASSLMLICICTENEGKGDDCGLLKCFKKCARVRERERERENKESVLVFSFSLSLLQICIGIENEGKGEGRAQLKCGKHFAKENEREKQENTNAFVFACSLFQTCCRTFPVAIVPLPLYINI